MNATVNIVHTVCALETAGKMKAFRSLSKKHYAPVYTYVTRTGGNAAKTGRIRGYGIHKGHRRTGFRTFFPAGYGKCSHKGRYKYCFSFHH